MVAALAVFAAAPVGAASSSHDTSTAVSTPPPSFAGPRISAFGGAANGLALGDVTGDRMPDIVTSSSFRNTVSVLANRSDGSFSRRRDYRTGTDPAAVAIGDLNRDGRLDVATANEGENGSGRTVSVLLNLGRGRLAPRHDYPTGLGPRSIAIGDLNGDAAPDLVTANGHDYTLSVLLNRGDATFAPRRDFDATEPDNPSNPLTVRLGDVNRDGNGDLITTALSAVSVLANRGDGNFDPPSFYEAGANGTLARVALADLNADGSLDLAAQDDDLNSAVSILFGRTDGSFDRGGVYLMPTPEGSDASLAVADLNRDNKPDLVAGGGEGPQSGLVSVRANRGDGTFRARRSWETGVWSFAVKVADLNRDRRPDVVATGGPVSVLMNATGRCGVPALVGKPIAAARQTIARYGCRTGNVRRRSSGQVPKGRVLLQKPRSGTLLRRGGKVDIVVSRGRATHSRR
jgi:hypothetical protein